MTPSPDRPLAVVVLAAGQGTRMRSSRPKVLHEIAGLPMLAHVLVAARTLQPARLAVVVRHDRDAVAAAVLAHAPEASIVDQDAVPGTGRALEVAVASFGAFEGDVLVELSDEVRQSIVEGMNAEELLSAAEDMEVDDLADLVGDLPEHVEGTSRIVRAGTTVWEKPFLSGEANMSHSFANLEHHHFKYALFRQPGDVHVHMFGTATLSFADGLRAEAGDVFEIEDQRNWTDGSFKTYSTPLSLPFPVPVEAWTRMRVPKSFNGRNPQARRDLASALRAKTHDLPPPPGRRGSRSGGARGGRGESAGDAEIARLRRELRAHPCHACPDREDHARWAERYHKLDRDTRTLRRRIEQRTNTIARQFDRVCEVLTSLEYLDGDTVTQRGQRLMRLYSDLDLVTAEALRTGVLEGLDTAGFAAALSVLVFAARRPDADRQPPVQRQLRLWHNVVKGRQAPPAPIVKEAVIP